MKYMENARAFYINGTDDDDADDADDDDNVLECGTYSTLRSIRVLN